MKKVLAGALTLAIAVAIAISAAAPAQAAARKIRIHGKKTVRVGKVIELDANISRGGGIRDKNIIWKSNKPSVVKVLRKRGDDTKIKGKKPGTAKITVRVKGTGLKASFKVKVKKAVKSKKTYGAYQPDSRDIASDEQKLNSLKNQISNIFKQIQNTQLNAQNRNQFYNFERQLDAIDHQLDYMGDKYERLWGTSARKMEYAVEQVENYLDDVEDYLESRQNWYKWNSPAI